MADYPVRGHWFSIQVLMPVLCLLANACSTSHRIEDRIFTDSPQGTVSLQTVVDASFRTAHPVSVSPPLLTRILQGIQALPDDVTTTMHVFSDDETRFLALLSSNALSKATKSELVNFRVLRGKSSETETIGGTIYIHGRLLHLTLDSRCSNEGQEYSPPQPRELEPPQLVLIPETNQRSSIQAHRDVGTPPLVGTLVIDYKMFGDELDLSSPTAQSRSLQAGPIPCPKADIPSLSPDDGVAALQETQSDSSEEAQTLKEVACEQAIELDALKEEMRVLRHILSEVETRKHNFIKPELPPALHRGIRNTIAGLTINSSCNSVCRPLHSKSPWLLDIFIENKLNTHLLTFNISRVFLKPV